VTGHDHVEDLLGAYALDAVDPDEAAIVEAHLTECPRCRAEVADHRAVAALLTSGTTEAPPPGLWDRIAADLGDPADRDEAPSAPVLDLGRARERRRGRVGLLVGGAVAAALLVVAAVGAVLVDQRRQLDDLRGQVAAGDGAVAALVADPESEVVDLAGPSGASARAVVGADGDAVLLGAGLPALAEGSTYQLWEVADGGEAVSLGLLGPDPDTTGFRLEGPPGTLAVTAEPAGGSPQPTVDPLVTGAIT